MTKLSYLEIDVLLKKLQAAIGASELHGLQSGLACGLGRYSETEITNIQLNELNCAADPKLINILNNSYSYTLEDLINVGFEFQPLLPKDDDSFHFRVRSIADWCRGFLCGLGLSGISENNLKQQPVQELVQDFSKIAYVENSLKEVGSDEDEANYFELIEFIRIAVQTIYVELNDDNALNKNLETIH